MASSRSAQSRARALATRDIEDIDVLRKNPVFARYFERRVLGELEKARNELLYGKNIDRDALWKAKVRFDAAYELSMMMIKDEAACRNLVSNEPGEI